MYRKLIVVIMGSKGYILNDCIIFIWAKAYKFLQATYSAKEKTQRQLSRSDRKAAEGPADVRIGHFSPCPSLIVCTFSI